MDSFVKKFFPDFNAPGANFGALNNGFVRYTYAQASLKVFDQQMTRNRGFYISQPMTLLGKLKATINTSASSLDGIGKPYLTPEGMLNLQVIGDTLKSLGGMQTANWSAHMGAIRSWPWSDNHVTLLVNALRYIMITKSVESGDLPSHDLPTYDDGHVRVDRNQWWDDYPQACSWDLVAWPGGRDMDNYPEIVRLTDSHPAQACNAIDLRGLTGSEARFVILMLGAWERRSRMRLDFDLPILSETIYYRADMEIPGLQGWLVTPEDNPVVPPPPNASVAWAALMKYVARNRIFDHFSTALHLVSSMMYQMLPVTAEGQLWLSFEWYASLPSFSSVRGRYTFLNEDEAAFVSHRSLQEWSYLGSKLEKINLMALVFAQAIGTGLAVRGVRKGLEINPEDLYNTYVDFYQPNNMMAAAAAEATRGAVPLTGMTGVYVNLTEDFDAYHPDWAVPVLNTERRDLVGYDVSTDEQGRLIIATPWVTLPGMPTLLLPLNPFPYNTIMSLKGTISADLGTLERRGLRLKAPNAWLVASLYRLAGYDLTGRVTGEVAGGSVFFAPNDVHLTWPVLLKPDEQADDIVFTRQMERDAHFLDLPVAVNSFFKGQKLDYDVKILRRGVSQTVAREREDLIECDGILSIFSKVTLSYTVTGGVQRLRAYITRNEQGFQFADSAKGGIIPSVAITAPAPTAEATS